MLCSPINRSMGVTLPTGKSMCIYQVLPITKEELEYKLESEGGALDLLRKIFPTGDDFEAEDDRKQDIEILLRRMSTGKGCTSEALVGKE